MRFSVWRLTAPIIFLCLAVPASAQNERIEPGYWKVTTNLIMNGAPMPIEVKNRCISAEQAGDLAKTLSPESATGNTECKSHSAMKDGRLKRLMQSPGQI